MRKIDTIVIHTSDSPDALDIGVKEIRKWHIEGNSWSDVGYHFIVRKNGTVELGRPVKKAGAHVSGYNSTSVAICWVGRDDCNPAQYQRLLEVTRALMSCFDLTKEAVKGHKEFPGVVKSCPNIDMDKFRRDL